MKKTICSLLMVVPVYSVAAELNDTAEVVSSRPIMVQINDTRQECYDEQVRDTSQGQQGQSYVGPVIGGIAGALLGNEVGGGHGRTAAIAAGAIVGTLVGHNLSNNQQYQPAEVRTVQRCRPVSFTREVPNGYEVTYYYNGMTGRTVTRNQPGRTINVGITAQ